MTAIRHTVEIVVEHWQWLQALDEAVGIVVEDDATVQQTVGVEDFLQFLHHLVSLVAPFIFHERCHVATCAVLGLQTSIVALYHQLGHIAHHLGIACHLVLVGKALIQDEVVVALEGVAIDAGIVIAMIGYQLL